MSDDTPKDPEELTAWLSQHYRERVRLFAMRRLRDASAAEDVVQDTLRTVLEALRAGRVRELAAIAGFAFETARHLCMHQGRSHGREEKALGRLAIAPAAQEPDVLTSMIDEQRRLAVRRALDALSDEDRRLLLMTYADGRDSDAIARELGVSAGAVRVRRHRALKRLADLLGGNDLAGSGT